MATLSFGVKTAQGRQYFHEVEVLKVSNGELLAEFPYGDFRTPFDCGFELEPAPGETLTVYWGRPQDLFEEWSEMGRWRVQSPIELCPDGDGWIVVGPPEGDTTTLRIWPRLGLVVVVQRPEPEADVPAEVQTTTEGAQ